MSLPSSPGYYNHAAVISLSTVNLHESNLNGVNDNDDVGVDGFSAQQLFSFAWQVARGMVSKWIKSEVTVGLPSKKPYAETIPEEHSRHYFMSSSVTPLWAFFFSLFFPRITLPKVISFIVTLQLGTSLLVKTEEWRCQTLVWCAKCTKTCTA